MLLNGENDIHRRSIDDPLSARSIYLSYAKRGMTDVRRRLIEFMEGKCVLECARNMRGAEELPQPRVR